MWKPTLELVAAITAGIALFAASAHAQLPTPYPRPGMATPYPRPGVPAAIATPYQRPGFPVATPPRAPIGFAPATPSFGRPALATPVAAANAMPAAPPRDIPLIEKKAEQLTNMDVSADGKLALSINPTKWKHAETDNFILHYRRVTEAQKVCREVEYDLWYVATTLKATKDRYTHKSHVYVFEDEQEWKDFLNQSNNPMKWAASYAYGDELFLNVRGAGNSGTGSFDSHTLAHETTHAVVARLFPRERWPLWMNEGFAEYMAGASIGSRKGISSKHYERNLQSADMPLEALGALTSYPTNDAAIRQLYETSEKFIRFLMTEMPKDRITTYIGMVVKGSTLKDAVLETYGDQFKDWDSFLRRYSRFAK